MIVRLFTKDYKNLQDPKIRNLHGIAASCVGIVANLAISAAKIIVGLIFASISVIADGLNNLSDTVSSFVNLIGFKISGKPADKKHPFGHARMEYVGALIVSFIILILGVQLAISSVQKIMDGGTTNPSYILMGVLVLSIAVKIGLAIYYRHVGKKINSIAMKSVMQDSINDVVATGFVLISAIITKFSGVNLDGYIGVAVALFILYSGIKLMYGTLSPLLGEKPDPRIVKDLTSKITSYPGILAIHDLVIHNYGPNKIFASVHAEVDAHENVMASHELVDKIERDLSDGQIHLVIHMDPVVTDDEETNEIKRMVKSVLYDIDPHLSLHDFRMILGPNRTNLIFDVVRPAESKIPSCNLEETIKMKIKEIDSRYETVLQIDENYIDIA